MSNIHPMSDLCNHFAEIIRDMQKANIPGHKRHWYNRQGIECYEEYPYESDIYSKL